MVEQIKLIYKPKGFEYFSNNKSEKKNALLILHQVLKKYYQIIMKENENYVDIILIYFNSLNIM